MTENLHPFLTPENGYLFRITHESNLPFILEHGIICPNHPTKDPNFQALANQDVDAKRGRFPVPISPGGVLHDYVPFYFAPRSPMLYWNHKQNICHQADIIYLVTQAQLVEEAGVRYCFTDAHAIIAYSQYFNQLSELDQIHWATMRARYWGDDSEKKRHRMAEFLVYHHVPLEVIRGIGVYNQVKKEQIEAQLTEAGCTHMVVKIQPKWYF